MKKSSIYGWKEVFSFTFHQTLKSKAFRFSFLFFLVLALVSMPIMNIIFNKDEEKKEIVNKITNVYVDNQTMFSELDFAEAVLPEDYEAVTFAAMSDTLDQTKELIEETQTSSVILCISNTDNCFNFEFIKPSEGPVTEDNVSELSDILLTYFDSYRIETLGVSEAQLEMLRAAVETKVAVVDIQGAEIIKEDTSITNLEYWFIYGIFMVVIMVNTMASSQIAMSILSDKSSKVVEYLLTSIKPMAIIIGKILAMLAAVVLQVVCLIIGVIVSNKVTSVLTGGEDSVLSQILPDNILGSLNFGNALLCLVLISLGFLFYATLAGLAGSTVSKMEEASDGLTLFTVVNLIGAYVGIGAANVMMASGINAFVNFACLFPLSSPYILPGAIIIGKMGTLTALIAIALQLVFVILLFRFVAKIYTMLILHTGNKIGIKELFKLSKTA